jgi:hypothetical protein
MGHSSKCYRFEINLLFFQTIIKNETYYYSRNIVCLDLFFYLFFLIVETKILTLLQKYWKQKLSLKKIKSKYLMKILQKKARNEFNFGRTAFYQLI